MALKIFFVYLMASFGKKVEVRSVVTTNGELVFIGVDPVTGKEIFNLSFKRMTDLKDHEESEFDQTSNLDT